MLIGHYQEMKVAAVVVVEKHCNSLLNLVPYNTPALTDRKPVSSLVES